MPAEDARFLKAMVSGLFSVAPGGLGAAKSIDATVRCDPVTNTVVGGVRGSQGRGCPGRVFSKAQVLKAGGCRARSIIGNQQSLPTICPIMLVLSFDVVGDASVGEGKDASSAGLRACAHNRVPEGADRHAIVHRP